MTSAALPRRRGLADAVCIWVLPYYRVARPRADARADRAG
ncbi:hypothetical protein ABIB54_002239 [Frigoribacterium sp. UYMn621]